ncbi:MAG: hypothetical protein IJF19_03125 [Clostridia bacterium]|nr:hypothetical protein [Clostridia bacterium]
MKKKLLSLLLASTMGLSMAGCSSVGLSVENLMHPPKAVGDKAEIQTLVDSVAGEGHTLKYPQSGNYRSAITMQDIDSDNIDEAIAFYMPQGDIATVHVLLMDNIDGKWQSVGDFKSQSTAVDSLSFCDLDGNGISEIVTCWKTYNASVNQLSVYMYEENKAREIVTDSTCSSLLYGDFTEDEGDELLLLNLFSTDKDATAQLTDLSENKSELVTIGTTPLNPDVVSYAQLLTGNIFENQFGAVIDGCTKNTGEYTTQLLYYNTYYKSLERISFTDNLPYNQALRSYPVMSKDINGDGIIEVPAAFKLNIEKDRTDAVAAADLYWCQQTHDGTVLLISHQAVSFAYGFSFEVPDKWEGKFTALTDYEKNEVTFYEWDKDKTTDILMKVKISEKEKEENLEGFEVLVDTDSRIYAYSVPESSNPLILTVDEIKSAFELM